MDVRHYSKRYPGDWQILVGMLLFLASYFWGGQAFQGGDYDPSSQWHPGYLGVLVGSLICLIGSCRTITAKGYPPLIALVGFTGGQRSDCDCSAP